MVSLSFWGLHKIYRYFHTYWNIEARSIIICIFPSVTHSLMAIWRPSDCSVSVAQSCSKTQIDTRQLSKWYFAEESQEWTKHTNILTHSKISNIPTDWLDTCVPSNLLQMKAFILFYFVVVVFNLSSILGHILEKIALEIKLLSTTLLGIWFHVQMLPRTYIISNICNYKNDRRLKILFPWDIYISSLWIKKLTNIFKNSSEAENPKICYNIVACSVKKHLKDEVIMHHSVLKICTNKMSGFFCLFFCL